MRAAVLDSWTQQSLGRMLSKIVSRCLEKEENRREFETWYEKTYGKKYVWKKGSEINAPKEKKL